MSTLKTLSRIAVLCGMTIGLRSLAAAQTYKLAGATLDGANAGLVRLVWVIDGGWLDPDGYALYRQVGGAEAKLERLNAKPITAEKAILSDPVLNRQIASRTPEKLDRGSSAEIFRSIASDYRSALANNKQKVTTTTFAKLRQGNSMVAALRQKLGPPPSTNPAPLSADEMTEQARAQVFLNAVQDSSFTMMDRLGITYLGRKTEAGMKIHYVLRKFTQDPGEKTPDLATFDIVVGQDPRPPAAIVEDPIQSGPNKVDLHFEAPANVDETGFGLLRYQVTRQLPGASGQLPLTFTPVMLNYMTVEGKLVPTITSLTDSAVPVGQTQYTVRTIDMFGRTTDAAPKSVTVLDTTTPTDPTFVVPFAAADGKSVQVLASTSAIDTPLLWFGPNLDNTISYRLLRYGSDPNNPTVVGTFTDYKNYTSDTFAFAGMANFNFESLTIKQWRYLRPDGVAAFFAGLQAKTGITPDKFPDMETAPISSLPQAVNTFFHTCIGSISVVPMVDPNPPADQTVTYKVVPFLVRNSREADPLASQPVTIPSFAPPTTNPTGLSGQDGDPPAEGAITKGTHTKTLAITSVALKADASDKRAWVQGIKSGLAGGAAMSDPINGTPPDPNAPMLPNRKPSIGRAVTLSWTGGTFTSPLRYRIYRAYAAGHVRATGGSFAGPPGTRPYQLQLDPNGIPDSDWVLVGTTHPGETQFVDVLPRTFRTNYAYRIVPVTRWNVTAAATAPVLVSVKATMPPSVPAITDAVATMTSNGVSPMGQVKVNVKALADKEYVGANYVLYRRAIAEPVAATTSSTAGSTSTITMNGKPTIVPLDPKKLKDPKSYVVAPQIGSRPLAAAGQSKSGGAAMGVAKADVSTVVLGAAARNAVGVKSGSFVRPTVKLTPEMIDWLSLSTYTKLNVQATLTNGVVTFVDGDLASSTHYLYRVVAVNSDGLASAASGIVDVTPVKLSADPATNGSATFDANASSMVVKWQAPASGAVSFIIERAIDNGGTPSFHPLDTIRVTSSQSLTYNDDNVRSGQKYIYRIITVDSDGNISKRIDSAGKVSGVLDIAVSAP